jgi:AraC family transcriptional regulator
MTGRDRLRELLDAVLDEEHRSLADMAHGAYSSPLHFSRRLARDAGEPPVAMRRRVALERAAWQLARGAAVTDVAFAAGYGSVEGFARAFARLRTLVELAKGLDAAEYARERLPGLTLLHWAGPEGSIAALLNRCVGTYEIWLASVEGADHPGRLTDDADPVALAARLDTVAPRQHPLRVLLGGPEHRDRADSPSARSSRRTDTTDIPNAPSHLKIKFSFCRFG